METLPLVYATLFVLLIVLVVCWIVLPLAVIGTKPILREMLAESKRANAHLANIEAYARNYPAPMSSALRQIASNTAVMPRARQ